MKHTHHKGVCLVIPVYNRPEYLSKCLESLQYMDSYPEWIIHVDDASTNPSVDIILHEHQHDHTVKITQTRNTGVRGALKTGIQYAFNTLSAKAIVVLDADAIVKSNFITRILSAYEKNGGNITSGFNTHNVQNPIEATGDGVVFKKHVNGINACFNKEQYEKYVAPSLDKVGNWDYNTSLSYQVDNKLFTITAPSLVQHIGLVSSMGHTNNGVTADQAYDFYY